MSAPRKGSWEAIACVSIHAALGVVALAAMLLLLAQASGCATTTAAASKGATDLWTGAPIPDYSAPADPVLAPTPEGGCTAAVSLKQGAPAPCLGVLTPSERLQLLLDIADQREPILRLLAASVEGRRVDRAWASVAYDTALIERDAADAQRKIAEGDRLRTGFVGFGIGAAVGGGIVGGLLLGLVVGAK